MFYVKILQMQNSSTTEMFPMSGSKRRSHCTKSSHVQSCPVQCDVEVSWGGIQDDNV